MPSAPSTNATTQQADAWQADIRDAHATIGQLARENRQLRERVAELEARLALMGTHDGASDLPESLSRWLRFLYGDDRCTCDWLWRRGIAEWERMVVDPKCPHHAGEYGATDG